MRRWFASKTTPIPPLPSTPTISYLPSTMAPTVGSESGAGSSAMIRRDYRPRRQSPRRSSGEARRRLTVTRADESDLTNPPASVMSSPPRSLPAMSSSAKIPLSGPGLPRKFGRYTLFDLIGRGGMAEIFLAHESLELGGQRRCVVKQIIPSFAEHPQFAEMLVHEAKLAARLDHANIVQVYDLGRGDGDLYIAMEYVEGFDLNELLRRCTKAKVPLPFEFALLVLMDVLRGLDYAHRRAHEDGRPLGIVHRDVSPSNVLISYEGQAKLCDFGIAHANELVTGWPTPGSRARQALQGKAGYMSPEHARGEEIDARADVFAAGILMWELVAGHRLYRTDGDKGPLLELARRAEVPPLPARGLPHEEELGGIVAKALEP